MFSISQISKEIDVCSLQGSGSRGSLVLDEMYGYLQTYLCYEGRCNSKPSDCNSYFAKICKDVLDLLYKRLAASGVNNELLKFFLALLFASLFATWVWLCNRL